MRGCCDVCGKQMEEGFVIDDSEYFCSKECLHTVYSDKEYNEEEGFTIKQYCVYCSFCLLGDCFYCSDKDEVLKESMVKKPNNCPSFSLCPVGHVETGKQYKPREKKEDIEPLEGQVTIWED